MPQRPIPRPAGETSPYVGPEAVAGELLHETVFAVKTLLGWELLSRCCLPVQGDIDALLPDELRGLERRIIDYSVVPRANRGRDAARIARLSGWRNRGDGVWTEPEGQSTLPGEPVPGTLAFDLHSIGHGAIWFILSVGEVRFDGGIDNVDDSLFDLVYWTRAIRAGAFPQARLFCHTPLEFTTAHHPGPPGTMRLVIEDGGQGQVADIVIGRAQLLEAWWNFLTRIAADPLLGHMFLCHDVEDDPAMDELWNQADAAWEAAISAGQCDPDDRRAEMSYYEARLRGVVGDDATEAYLADARLMLRTLEIPERWSFQASGG